MKKLILIMPLLLALWSCNNDLVIFTEERNIPFVYGIINRGETEHYIKVTKLSQKFVEDVEIEDMYYEDDSIKVYIEEFSDGNLFMSYPLESVIAKDKDEGIFPHPTHKYYKLSNTVLLASKDRTYSVRIELSDGTVVENADPFRILNPFELFKPDLKTPSGTAELKFKNAFGEYDPCRFHWGHDGGGREDLNLMLAIEERNVKLNTVDTIIVPILVYDDIPNTVNEEIFISLGLDELYSWLQHKLVKDKNIRRRLIHTTTEQVVEEIPGGPILIERVIKGYGIGLNIWSESKDLTTYETIIYSATQEGISKDIPDYTNLVNALGIFSTRVELEVPIEEKNLYFGQETLDFLSCSPHLWDYNFGRAYLDNVGELQFDYSPTRCQ